MKASSTSIDRRLFLHSSTAAMFGAAALARSANAAGVRNDRGKARRCILVYLLGGPSHLDTWDLKPHALREYRGEFAPIATNTAGIQISEHLPQLARQVDRLSIIRSLGYRNGDHPFMTYYTLTGRVSPRPLGGNSVLPPSRDDDPHMGCIVSKFKHGDGTVPGYVAVPEVQVRMSSVLVAGGGRAGFLGPQYNPLAINDDPRHPGAAAALTVPDGISPTRHSERVELLALLDGFGGRLERIKDHKAVQQTAIELTGTQRGESLVSLAAEKPQLRARYGRHRFGQSLLLARRLVQHGVSFVGVHFNNMSKCDGWDTHKNNFACLKEELLPVLDQGLSALLDDLADCGLLDETLVVCMGEFGRTPKINTDAGRDHWGQCGTAVMAGGGVRGGQVIGASDKNGAYPTESPVSPPDIVASIYHALGIHPGALLFDPRFNRTLKLSDGHVIERLF